MKKCDHGRFGWLLFLGATVPLMFAQNPQPGPVPPLQPLGPQLIAWSVLQEPQPLAQPLPPPEGIQQQGVQSQNPAPAQQQNQNDAQSGYTVGPEQTTPQSFTGTIDKTGGRYVLKVSRYNTFELDDQEKAREYVGLQVRITATVDPNGENLHIIAVEPLS
jgi:hypothetical protein